MSTLSDDTILSECPYSNEVIEKEKKIADISHDGVHSHYDAKGQLVYVAPINGETFVIPDAPRRCTWTKNAQQDEVFFPHTSQNW